jgi:hypothetical protein
MQYNSNSFNEGFQEFVKVFPILREIFSGVDLYSISEVEVINIFINNIKSHNASNTSSIINITNNSVDVKFFITLSWKNIDGIWQFRAQE